MRVREQEIAHGGTPVLDRPALPSNRRSSPGRIRHRTRWGRIPGGLTEERPALRPEPRTQPWSAFGAATAAPTPPNLARRTRERGSPPHLLQRSLLEARGCGAYGHECPEPEEDP